MIVYTTKARDLRVTLSDTVLEILARHRQTSIEAVESGGQLFGCVHSGIVDVAHATGPRPGDRRGRCSFRPDRSAERSEIRRLHASGLHYVGDWHTHAEEQPAASWLDLRSIGETARLSRHTVGPLALVVVGLALPPAGLYVCLHDGIACTRLAHLGADAE